VIDVFAWIVLIILAASAAAMFFIAGFLPGDDANKRTVEGRAAEAVV
jgi:hypothetical protein